jgi:hypothetical protein
MLAIRSVQQSNHCARDEFLYELKAGPAGGRLRRPSSRRQRYDGHRGTGLTLHAAWTGRLLGLIREWNRSELRQKADAL